ncbi:solute carrier family 41 member 1-like [Dreissena polymorpha]|uniref:solute carrier family 41 member 1-like n=1 Tax=Dreissena polymorpha TaxID=45954 RepID=UPI002263DC38|nr:solute carrier family 41 member 1-like [Dreissena polymorpha]
MTSSGNGDHPYNLRSRKPRMVPYSQSGPSSLVSMDTKDVFPSDIHTNFTVKPDGREKILYKTNSGINGNTLPASLEIGSVRVDEFVDKGGGDSASANGSEKSEKEESFRDGDTEETSFINGNADTQPLIVDDSFDDDIGKVIVKLEDSSETSLQIILQVSFPYLIAGFGMVAAGMVLDAVQHWPVFVEVSEIFVLVPALLGLKGNLEMTLASRLSTQANLGNMSKSSEKWKMIAGNMSLIQAQALVVGFLASLFAMVMGWIPDGKFNMQHALLLCASSMCTAALASFVLGCVMVGVVLLSKKVNINPDNVATPIAASLGDITTLSLLAGIGSLLFKAIGTQQWLSPLLIVIFILLIPLWIYFSLHNKYTHDVVYNGWSPVLSAMVISSIGGVILGFTVSKYPGIAVFQPVINGVGGNLVAVQASRISTSLHKVCRPGNMPVNMVQGCPNCMEAFIGTSVTARAARMLLALVIPGHLIFMYTISFMTAGHTSITLKFSLLYLSAAVLQVAILLYIANWMVHYIWRVGDDPDNVAIPYLTALGDLLGTGFLALAFQILFMLGDRDSDLGD